MASRKGQGVLEYSLIITVVAAALMMMGEYVKRSVYANVKLIEHQLNKSSN